MEGKKELFGFRKLFNQYIIIKNDVRNIAVAGTAFPHKEGDNAILTYCFVHPRRGIAFEVLAMAKISETGMGVADLRIDVREANPSTSLLIEYNSISGELIDFKPDKNLTFMKDFDNKVAISRHLDEETPQETRDMREISQIDRYRHEVFPDDLAVTFVGKLPKPEAIWCKGILSDDGEMKGKLLNEPWDTSIGLHQDDIISIEIRMVDGKESLFAVLDNENDSEQRRLNEELQKLKRILKENPEFCTDSIRFNELIAECGLSDRLKDNLLLCIEDDVVQEILALDAYTDDVVSRLANKMTKDCNLSSEQAIESVLWWMNILELDEAARKERNKRLQTVVSPVSLEYSTFNQEEKTEPKSKKVKNSNLDYLEEIDIQLGELMSRDGKQNMISVGDSVPPAKNSPLDDLLDDLQMPSEIQKDEKSTEKGRDVVQYDKCGEITYSVVGENIHISGIEIEQDMSWKDKLVIIPETIDGNLVTHILPEALNMLRKMRVYGVIVPSGLLQVGSEDIKLYEGFSEKGVFPKVDLYIPRNAYRYYDEIGERKDIISVITKDAVENLLLMKLNPLFKNDNIWKRPVDGCWINRNSELVWYSGDEKSITIDCKTIRSEAFVNSDVENITFSKKVLTIRTNAIHHCDKLISLTMLSEVRSFISRGAIHDCGNLTDLVGKWGENCEMDSCLYSCPKIGNIIKYDNLVTCQSEEEIYVVGADVKRIANGAFESCKKLKLVVVPDNVKKVMYDAFDGTDIEVVIFRGEYTTWEAHQIKKNEPLYMYAEKDSNVIVRIAPDKLPENVILKNIEVLKDLLDKNRFDDVYDYCKENMSGTSDEEMIPKFYTW